MKKFNMAATIEFYLVDNAWEDSVSSDRYIDITLAENKVEEEIGTAQLNDNMLTVDCNPIEIEAETEEEAEQKTKEHLAKFALSNDWAFYDNEEEAVKYFDIMLADLEIVNMAEFGY